MSGKVALATPDRRLRRNVIFNVFAYLQHLLLFMPDTDWQNHPEELDDLMPWAPEVQEQCK